MRTQPSWARQSRRRSWVWLIGVVVVALFVVISIGYVLAYRSSERTVTFTVTDKGSVVRQTGSGDSTTVHNEYRIYTDHGVFVVTDSWVYLRFNSADLYGKLRVDHTYTCKAAGWRFGLASWFPNLISCEEAS